jgi:hypothetical protein
VTGQRTDLAGAVFDATLVNTRDLVELLILNVGLELHVLSRALFSIMVIWL